jgi:hypothetical protein
VDREKLTDFSIRMNSKTNIDEIQAMVDLFKDNQDNPVQNINYFTDWLNQLSNDIFVKKKANSKYQVLNEEGFNHKRWYDAECKFLQKRMFAARKFGKKSVTFCKWRNKYINSCKRKKLAFEMMMSEKLASLRCSNSKAFWNLLKEGFGANKIGNIDMKDWAAHFSSLLSSYEEVPNSDFEERHIKVDELDKEFSIQEIREAIFYHLKCHKASGPDGVLNEVLKWSLEWTQNVILLLFNQLWRSEIYPANWNEVFLLPIHKNGSYKDPNNYRGIAITSCLGKLFCILINKRLYNWAEKNQKLSRWQGGFRRRMGCDVQSFRLLAAILHQFSQKKGYKGRKQGRVFA